MPNSALLLLWCPDDLKYEASAEGLIQSQDVTKLYKVINMSVAKAGILPVRKPSKELKLQCTPASG